MSHNPIEQQRLKREKVWEKQRAKEEARQAAKRPKERFADVQERMLAEKKAKEEEARRASHSVPLATIQRDVVSYLRGAHRAVTLEEIGLRVRYDVASNPELVASLQNHVRVKVVGDDQYAYKARYEVSNIDEMAELIESCEEGVVAVELRESYHEAMQDVEKLKQTGRVFALPNKILGSDILFGCYSKFEMPMPASLKDSWHRVAIPDPKKLETQLRELGQPVAAAPVTRTKIRRKRQKKNAHSSGRSIKDHYNDHVPDFYRDDSWKDTLSVSAQMYGKN